MMFDLVVLGQDPAGIRLAELAALSGWKTAVIDDPANFSAFKNSRREDVPSLSYFTGRARFDTPQSVEIVRDGQSKTISGHRMVIATGTRVKRPAHVPFDRHRILDFREAMSREDFAGHTLVVGLGSQGAKIARQVRSCGSKVSLVDQKPVFAENKTTEPLSEFQTEGNSVRCGETVMGVKSNAENVSVFFANGSIETFTRVVFAVGQIGCTDSLQLPDADLVLDETGRVWCDDFGQTAVPGLFAVGSVVGFPRLPEDTETQAMRVWQAVQNFEVVGDSGQREKPAGKTLNSAAVKS